MDSDTNGVAGDPLDDIVFSSVGANLSVALGANLNVDVGATDVTVASLKLGGTAGAVTTTVSSTGGKLVFENFEANDTTPADPLPDICAFNCTAAQITSGGVVGSINTITAPVHLSGERLEFAAASTNNISLSGPITMAPGTANGRQSISIRSFMPAANKVTISGNISLVDTVALTGAQLTLNDDGQVPPTLPATGIAGVAALGTLEISGVISNTGATSGGTLLIGQPGAGFNSAPSTIILSGDNSYTGQSTLHRANLVLGHNNALGIDTDPGNDRAGGASMIQGQRLVGNNIASDNDTRTINISTRFAQWQTVNGANSLTWSGVVTQSNSRGWINLLPAGKTLTVSGPTYAESVSSTDTSTNNRIFSYDGSGTTVVTGGWRDKIKGGLPEFDVSLGHYRKTGTGTLLVSDPGAISDYTGDIIVDQGVIRFSNDTMVGLSRVVTSTGGAIGVDTGTFTNTTLLGKLDFTDHGGLMLTAGESAAALNFTIGDLANALNMSVAPPQGPTPFSYTGIITPATDTLTSVPTYRLGGGNGVLTLPNNQLTGARNVQITNGGEVQLNGANTYTGVTTVQGKYHTTLTNQGIANTTSNIGTLIYEGTTLSANNLASGASSSVGGASDAAASLVIQGSTLKYTGGTASTNRLFTVGTGGATIDASGGGALTLNNTGTLDMDVAEPRTATYRDDSTNLNDGVTGGFNTRQRLHIAQTGDLVTGMGIVPDPTFLIAPIGGGATAPFPSGSTITNVNSAIKNPAIVVVPDNVYPTNITMNNAVALTNHEGTGTVAFAGVARTLSLSGTNTGDNTLRPLIADAGLTVGGGVGTVNLAKNGTGKWILTNNNTYTGTTSVNAGTLLVNGAHSGTGAVSVAAGATLGGTGSLAGAVTNNGRINAGASVGTLALGGGLTMGANSFLDVELLGSTADLLAITGNLDLAALGQSLNVIDLGKTGTQWLIATYTGALTGTFESVSSGYTVDYGISTPGQVKLNFSGVVGLLGDFNSDNKVDAADYVIWRENGASSLPNDGGAADQNARYGVWRSHFGNTSPGSGATLGLTAGVPEPAAWMLAAFAFGWIASLRRSRRR